MSIPNYEMGNLTQSEFWKWSEDPNCAGLPGQRVPIPYIDRFLTELDRRSDRREAAKKVLTFDDILFPLEKAAPNKRKRINRKRLLDRYHRIEPYPAYLSTLGEDE